MPEEKPKHSVEWTIISIILIFISAFVGYSLGNNKTDKQSVMPVFKSEITNESASYYLENNNTFFFFQKQGSFMQISFYEANNLNYQFDSYIEAKKNFTDFVVIDKTCVARNLTNCTFDFAGVINSIETR